VADGARAVLFGKHLLVSDILQAVLSAQFSRFTGGGITAAAVPFGGSYPVGVAASAVAFVESLAGLAMRLEPVANVATIRRKA
jgi:hypothetical protein